MYKIIYFVYVIIVIYGCNISQKQIVIKQIPCNESILLLRDTIKNEIDCIISYYDFDVSKTCFSSIYISNPTHYDGYNRYESWGRVRYLLEDNKIFLFDDNNDNISALYYRKPRIYRIETWQSISSQVYEQNDRLKAYSYSEQKQFLKPYLDSMNKLHLDTLLIGSIAEVQRTNPKFFDYFIKGDSVFINFIYKNKYIVKYLPIELK